MRFDILESNSNGDWDEAMWVGGDWTRVVCVDWEDSLGVVEAMDLGLWYHVRFWSLKVVINGGKIVIEREREREREREKDFWKMKKIDYTSSSSIHYTELLFMKPENT